MNTVNTFIFTNLLSWNNFSFSKSSTIITMYDSKVKLVSFMIYVNFHIFKFAKVNVFTVLVEMNVFIYSVVNLCK